MTSVGMWFDPECPWAWAASRRLCHGEAPIGRDPYLSAPPQVRLPAEPAGAAGHDEASRASRHAGPDSAGKGLGASTCPARTGERIAAVGPAPRGQAAGRLGDGVLLVTGTDGFSELKRARTPIPA